MLKIMLESELSLIMLESEITGKTEISGEILRLC